MEFERKIRKSASNGMCCVSGCNSKKTCDTNLSFHKIPKEGHTKIKRINIFGQTEYVDKRKEWLSQVKVVKEKSDMFVCSLHFVADDYFLPEQHAERRRLRPNAIPKERNVPVQTTKKNIDRKTRVLESYWTYELCHGRHVRQYHEEREGKKVNVQEYSLGTFDRTEKVKLSAEYDELAKNPNRKAEIPVKKVDGINMPYVEIDMKDGTMCDLNSKPRSIKVLYVCYQHGKHEIFSLKEISSCEYEAVVLSPFLCNHPDYKPQNTGENDINCRPVDESSKKPKSLLQLEAESLKLRHMKVADGEPRVRVEIRPMDLLEKHYNVDESVSNLVDQAINVAKSSPVQNFLSGKNCLNGGNGWWKYEFCYGRTVTQYHMEKDGSKTTVNLGKFDKEKHLKWIEEHPHKKPKPLAQRKQLSHFYSDGSICDKTGKLRQTEVKLKCVTNPLGSQSSVSLFLLEPKTCEYILGVESPLICNILQYADSKTGLINEKDLTSLTENKSTVKSEEEEVLERMANHNEL